MTNEKEKNSRNNKFNRVKWLKIFLVCSLVLLFSSLHIKQQYARDYSIAVKADLAGDAQKAKEYYTKAINDTIGLNPYPLLGLGKLYSLEGKYPKAEPLITKALDISKKRYKPNDPRVVDATYALGTLYSREGKYHDAELLFSDALQLVDIGNIKLKADILESLGEAYLFSKDYKIAEKYLLQSLNLKKKIYDEKQLYREGAYTDLGILYTNIGKYKKAKQIFKYSLDVCNQNSCSDNELVNIYMNLSALLTHMKNYKESEKYAKMAMNLHNSKKFNKDITTIQILCELSGISLIENDKTKALNLLKKALELSTEITGKNSNLSVNIRKSFNEIKRMEG